MPPAGLQPPSGEVVDASSARIMVNMTAIGVRTTTIAGVCSTSESSVKRILRYSDEHGGVRVPRKGKGKQHDPRWHFGGALGQPNLARLDRLVASMDPSATLDEIYAAYAAACPPPVPKFSTVAKAVARRLEYTTKRLSTCAPARNDLLCRAWYQRVSRLYRRHQLVCVDEVGVNRKSANRNRGRSKRGTPAVTHLNVMAGGSKKSALGVFTEEGFIDVHVADGAFDTDAFFTAIDASVIPHMRPFPGPRSVLLIDNCRIHNPRELLERVRKVGGRVLFLEPYDPQHMPIEVGFRAMKRRAACRVVPRALSQCCSGRPGPSPSAWNIPKCNTTRRWMRKHRERIRDMPPDRRIRLAAMCVTHKEAHQAFAASGF